MNNIISLKWTKSFPELASISDPVWQRTMRSARIINFKSGEDLSCTRDLLFNLDGNIRVRVAAHSGHEMTMCKVPAGRLCWLNFSSLFGLSTPHGLTATAETAVCAALLNRYQVDDAMSSCKFRNFVLRELCKGLTELSVLLEDVAFGQVDRRIAQCLLDNAKTGPRIAMTHSYIALDIGTAREVVSRQLKDFERQGWVTLNRGHIIINEERSLRNLINTKI